MSISREQKQTIESIAEYAHFAYAFALDITNHLKKIDDDFEKAKTIANEKKAAYTNDNRNQPITPKIDAFLMPNMATVAPDVYKAQLISDEINLKFVNAYNKAIDEAVKQINYKRKYVYKQAMLFRAEHERGHFASHKYNVLITNMFFRDYVAAYAKFYLSHYHDTCENAIKLACDIYFEATRAGGYRWSSADEFKNNLSNKITTDLQSSRDESIRKKEQLIGKLMQMLQTYKKRIETDGKKGKKAGEINFSAGFGFFGHGPMVTSRTLNRKTNYYLAGEVYDALEKRSGSLESFNIEELFNSISERRNKIAATMGPDYVERGINSKDLNKILDLMSDYVNETSRLGLKINYSPMEVPSPAPSQDKPFLLGR